MSVTFTFARFVETETHGTVLWHGAQCEHTCPTPEACEDAQVYGPRCCDHVDAAKDACGCEAFDLNVSNTNAIQVLERLGVDVDPEWLVGSMTGDDLLGRALVGNVGRDDMGVSTFEHRGEAGARIVECGLRAGYFNDTLGRLATLATEAKARGVLVGWS